MIITVAGSKGGVGKTLVACQLAAHWHSAYGSTVLLDADPQGTARRFSENALASNAPCPVTLGIQADVATTLRDQAQLYDRLVIDTQGRQNAAATQAIARSHLVLVPCGPTLEDVDGALVTWETVRQAQALNQELQAAAICNQWPARPTAMSRAAVEHLRAAQVPALKLWLGRRVTFNEAFVAGQAVTVYAPRSPASRELRALANDVEALAAGTIQLEEVSEHVA